MQFITLIALAIGVICFLTATAPGVEGQVDPALLEQLLELLDLNLFELFQAAEDVRDGIAASGDNAIKDFCDSSEAAQDLCLFLLSML